LAKSRYSEHENAFKNGDTFVGVRVYGLGDFIAWQIVISSSKAYLSCSPRQRASFAICHRQPRMSVTTSDKALADQLRARNPEAVSAIYDRFGSLVYSLFLRITRDQAVAEDLVQELFIRIWNRAHEFDPDRGSLGVWILSIARHMGIDYIRSAHARFTHRLQPMETASTVARTERGPESTIDNGRVVKAAFALLNDKQKRVLELAYFEGFSQTEIADRLQEPLGTVKSWTRSALQSLRSSIKGNAAT
jgi:RNA polymerase sigma-70 factor (ECF subfamily)